MRRSSPPKPRPLCGCISSSHGSTTPSGCDLKLNTLLALTQWSYVRMRRRRRASRAGQTSQ